MADWGTEDRHRLVSEFNPTSLTKPTPRKESPLPANREGEYKGESKCVEEYKNQ